jgi:hypothetical protein
MGNSRKSGPSGHHHHWLRLPHHAHPATIPVRPRGPLGLFDQAGSRTARPLGDTPGPVGLHDWADLSLSLWEGDFTPLTVPFWRPGATAAPAGVLSLKEAQEIALKITTYFEGGSSMNYQALAGDFDGQGTSFGLIQWNFGQNTLGPLLKKMLAKDAKAFAACFGADSDYDTLKKALDASNNADQLKWARDRQKNKKAAWSGAFKAIGAVAQFNVIQRDQAIANYHPLVVTAVGSLREIAPEFMTNIELRSYAALFDLCVQQSGIAKVLKEITGRVKKEKPANQLDFLKIAVVERARKATGAWVSDCISRRLGILGGSAYESNEHDQVAKRSNPQFSLITESGTKTIPDF